MARKVKEHGFSLIELMVVVAIVVVIALIAIPEYREVRIANRIYEDINKLSLFVKEARLWAFTHKQEVTVSLDNTGSETVITATWDNGGTSTNIYTPLELQYTFTGSSGYVSSGVTITTRGTYKTNGHIRLDASKQKNPAEREDCITVNNTRVRIGKYNGSSCIAL